MANIDQGSQQSELPDGTTMIDADAHFTEPPDLWSSRAPASLKDRVPAQKTVDGLTAWYIDGQPWASIGGNTIREGHQKVLGYETVQPFEAVDRAAWSVPERLELLDAMGVEAQVVYPNGVGFSSNHLFAIEDLDLRTAVLRMYNDFYVDIQEESGGRLLPQALLPYWDMDLTVQEMTRLLDQGIRGFTLSDKPELLGLPELPEPFFDPMWDLFNESGAVANFHIGSGARREDVESIRSTSRQAVNTGGTAPKQSQGSFWNHLGRQRRVVVHASLMFMSNCRIVANLLMSDLFDRYTKLKIVSAESGIGWVPFILESLEFLLDEMVTDTEERAKQRRRPTDYFREHIYVMFWFEDVAPVKLIPEIGIKNVMVETDIPHSTSLYPGAMKHFAKVLEDVDEPTRRRVLRDNAAELYEIDARGPAAN